MGNNDTRRFPKINKPWLIFLGCMVLISILIDVVFIRYRRKLEDEFYNMAVEQLDSYTEAQRLEVRAYIESVDDNLQAIRMLMESPEIDLSGDALERYLERFNQENNFVVSYITREELVENLQLPASQEGDRVIYERMLRGETVLSDIRYSRRKSGYFFGYAVPVKNGQELKGALRCIVDAAKLMETKQTMTQNSLIASYVVNRDGKLVYSKIVDGEIEADARGQIFYEDMSQNVQKLNRGYFEILQQHNNTQMIAKDKGLMTFVSGTPLGLNDWYIVNVSRACGLLERTRIIMRNTIESNLILMGITLVFGVAVYLIYSTQRKRISFESERYQLLSEFSDTVLMQYYYKVDTLVFTSNVQERFDVEALEKSGYLKENRPVLKMSDEDWALVRELLEHPVPGTEIKTVKFRAMDKRGDSPIWCYLQLRFVFDKSEAVAAIGKITDISKQKLIEEELVKQAQIDGLTGICNKETAENRIADLVEARRTGYLFIMDVDNFKKINDTYGHVKGDETLVYLGSILREVFRKADVVGRIGGDEFVAFVSGEGISEALIAERAKLILERMRSFRKDGGIEVTLSIGIASCPKNGQTYEELYIAADKAMYYAKRRGKNQYYIGDENLEA